MSRLSLATAVKFNRSSSTLSVAADQANMSPRVAAVAVGLVLMALYWLTASGAFHSIDEHAVFSVSRNLVYHGRIDQSSLFWATPYDAQAKIGIGNELYSKYGIGHSLLVAVTVILGRLIPGAGLVTTSVLLTMVATALTAALLVQIASQLGYSVRTGVLLGLLYGGSSFAWVYARTLFGEPLVALAWLLAVWLLLQRQGRRQALLAGLCLALSITIRPAMVVLVPLFLGLLWVRPLLRYVLRVTIFGIPLVLAAAGLLAFNAWRFGNPFDFGYVETFNGSLVAGLFGFLFSLDRSIFLFAPPLVAFLWSFPAFARRHGGLGWQILIIPLASLILYSLWPVFWGGPVWGPRYLLPSLPIAFVLLLPAIERALVSRGWPRSALVVLGIAGLLMQLRGAVWNSLPLTQTLGQRYPLWLLPPQSDHLDLVWIVYRPLGLAISAGLLGMALFALWRSSPGLVRVTAIFVTGASVFLSALLGGSPLGYLARPAYTSALAYMREHGSERDALILNPAPYQEPIAQMVWFLNEPRATLPFFGIHRLPVADSTPGNTRAEDLLRKYDRLWLLTEGVGPGATESTTERFLLDAAAYGGTSWLEDGFRLTRFAALLPEKMQETPGVAFGDAAVLESWAVTWTDERQRDVHVYLSWRATGRVSADLHTFVQILNARGEAIALWDSIPGSGLMPSASWQTNQVIQERLALSLPHTRTDEDFRIIAGLYEAETGTRLRTPDDLDFFELTRFHPQ